MRSAITRPLFILLAVVVAVVAAVLAPIPGLASGGGTPARTIDHPTPSTASPKLGVRFEQNKVSHTDIGKY